MLIRWVFMLAVFPGCAASSIRDAEINCISSESAERQHAIDLTYRMTLVRDELLRCKADLTDGLLTPEKQARCQSLIDYTPRLAAEINLSDRRADQMARSCQILAVQADDEADRSRARRAAVSAAFQGIGNGLSAAGDRPRAAPTSCSSLVVGPTVQTNCY